MSDRIEPAARGSRTLIALIATLVIGCDVNAALEKLSEARQISAELNVQFTRASDASQQGRDGRH